MIIYTQIILVTSNIFRVNLLGFLLPPMDNSDLLISHFVDKCEAVFLGLLDKHTPAATTDMLYSRCPDGEGI